MTTLDSNPVLTELRGRLLAHPLYGSLRSAKDVCTFMRHHVFCVWDFQSLLKALQQRLTCVAVPWLPTPDSEARRLINEIVLEEESDEDGQGGHASHFELYLRAMRAAGADLGVLDLFLSSLRAGCNVAEALRGAGVPLAVAASVRQTLDLAIGGDVHRIAAAFALGREDIIPGMFIQLLEGLAQTQPTQFGAFSWYLRRHVDLDGDRHGPLARRMLERLCGTDPEKRREAVETACSCLAARLAIWDEIFAAIESSRS